MKAGIYARVSTDEQQSNNQLIELREYAKRHGFDVEEFIDHGFSGALDQDRRPALNKLMEAARYRKIDFVLCWDLSRFARSMKQLVNMVEELRKWNVGFTTLRENIDTNSANGRLVFHIFAGLAEFERELIRERVNLGLRRARSEGKVLGRPRIPMKYSPDVVKEMTKAMSIRKLSVALEISDSSAARIKRLYQKPPLVSVS